MHGLYAAIALLLAVSSAAGQERPPKPYEPVAIVRPNASEDASLAAFREALAAAARSRVYARLAALVRKRDFFWDRDFGRQFDARKATVDNLALAIALEHDDGEGWQKLEAFAAEPTAEPLESRPGVICTPVRPAFDGVTYAKLLDTTYTGPIDWAYPRADATAVYSAPQADADPIGFLGSAFIRLLGFAGPDSEPDPGRKLWARIAMPDGRIGFVKPGRLMALTAERLCYVKDAVDGWRIAGFVAGGN